MHIWQVNAFTNEPFKGNPAGVAVLAEFYEWIDPEDDELEIVSLDSKD